MKKVILILCLLLSGCFVKPQYYLYLYYAKTCPVCKSFINYVIPQLKDIYQDDMEIVLYDIDEGESKEAYAKTCSLLKDYYVTDDSGSIPFIVLDGYIAIVGYEVGTQDEMVNLIQLAIAGKEIPETEDIYYFQEGKTFH